MDDESLRLTAEYLGFIAGGGAPREATFSKRAVEARLIG
jgi:hypothetical protein